MSEKVGSIVTTLSGSGRARLDFGNCHSGGTVKAFLDGQEIGSADALIPHKVVEFNFNPGSVLRMSEYDKAVIQFNSLQMIDCPTGKGLSDVWHETFASFGKLLIINVNAHMTQ